MRQLLAGWNLAFLLFLLGYAGTEIGVAWGFWRNRRNEDGQEMFGFKQIAGHFLSSALFLLIFLMGLTALSCPTAPRLRWWLLAALIVRACGTWPLATKYSIIPRMK